MTLTVEDLLKEGSSGKNISQRLCAWAADPRRAVHPRDGEGSALDARLRKELHDALAARSPNAPMLRKALLSLEVMGQLNRRSHVGRQWDPVIDRENVLAIAQDVVAISEVELLIETVIGELRHGGLIVTRQGEDASRWQAIGPYRFFFCRTDALFQCWNPEVDAREICNRLRHSRVLTSLELDSILGWGPRRLNSAVTYAQLQRWLRPPYRSVNHERYVLPLAYLTEVGKHGGEG